MRADFVLSLRRLAMEELRKCYREVPEMFFRSNFSLGNQEIFNQLYQIFEKGEQEDSNYFSSYLDIVEIALLRQIWYKSPAFFRALDDFQGLQYQVFEAIQLLITIRNRLQSINDTTIHQSLSIPKLSRKQKNVAALQEKLTYMRQLLEGKNAVVSLLEIEDYYTAHELIFSIKDIYNNHLKSIYSMRKIADQLVDLSTVITNVLCNKFVTLGIQWEDYPVTNESLQKSSQQKGSSGYIDYIQDLDNITASIIGNGSKNGAANVFQPRSKQAQLVYEQNQELIKLVSSLIASETLPLALNMYKSRLIEGVKLIIRTCVMEYMTSDTDFGIDFENWTESSGGNANGESGEGTGGGSDNIPYVQRVREMSSEQFLSSLSMCFEHLTTSLQKAKLFHKYFMDQLTLQYSCQKASMSLGDVTGDLSDELLSPKSSSGSQAHGSALATFAPPLSEKTYTELQVLSKSSLQQACEIIQKSINQLINFRKDVNSKFNIDKMIFFWEISLRFVSDLETCTGSQAYAMRQCLLLQSKSFLDTLHEQSKNKLVNTLDNERWIQCDVNADRQKEINRLSSGKAFLVSKDETIQGSSGSAAGAGGSTGSGANSASGSVKKASSVRDKEIHPVVIEGVEYKVVWSVLLLVEINLSYLDIAFHFPPITNEVISKIVELIRLFNNRTKQLVLGAQAIQSAARLRSISAKHLAITSQSLSLFLALLPHIRAALLAQVNSSKQAVMSTELDRISQDLFDHHASIMAKLVNIVSDMIEVSAATKLGLVDWDLFQPAANPTPTPAAAEGGSAVAASNTAAASAPAASSAQVEYFEEIQKNIITLHKVLITILPNEQISDIFTRIFSLLNRKLLSHFEDIFPSTTTGKQRILDEITYLVTNLSRLKAIDSTILTTQLEESFRRKYQL
jgi:vacuolar protein sorting-associated protein 54